MMCKFYFCFENTYIFFYLKMSLEIIVARYKILQF